MSVITFREDRTSRAAPNDVCLLCSEGLLPPFLQWDNLLICGRCCLKAERGLTADLAHAAAIMKLRTLGYHGETLVRTTRRQLAEDQQREIEIETELATVRRLHPTGAKRP